MFQTTEEAIEYINAQENFQSVANLVLKLSKQYSNNKKIKQISINLSELWFYLESLKTRNRLLNKQISQTKYELNKFKDEYYDIKREIKPDTSGVESSEN